MCHLVLVQRVNKVRYIRIIYDAEWNPVVLMYELSLLLGRPNRMYDADLHPDVGRNEECRLLFHYRIMLDVLHDQDFYLLFVCTICGFQFLILDDKCNLCCYSMLVSFVHCDDYVHERFRSMCNNHPQESVNVTWWLHDMQVDAHHAMDIHFDLMIAMDDVVVVSVL